MQQRSTSAALEKLEVRIQALRAKTAANGCTEDETLSAAAKVAELLDRHDLSLTDVEMRAAPCERLAYAQDEELRWSHRSCNRTPHTGQGGLVDGHAKNSSS